MIFCAFAIKTSWFQTSVARYAASYMSSVWQTEVAIDKVDIELFNEIRFDGFFIRDLHGDTLIHTRSVYVKLGNWSIQESRAELNLVKLDQAYVNLRKYEADSVLNFQFIVDFFASDKPVESKPFYLSVNSIELTNTRFSYNDDHKKKTEYGVDFNHILLEGLNVQAENLSLQEDNILVNVKSLSFFEQSGLVLSNFSSRIKFSPRRLMLDHFLYETPHSAIDIPHFTMDYGNFGNFEFFIDSVRLNGVISKSKLHLKDLSYFVSQFREMGQAVVVNAAFWGTVNDMSLENLFLQLTPDSYIKGNGTLVEITRPELTQFDFDLEEFSLNKADVESFDMSGFGVEELRLPVEVARLGQIVLAGVVKGSYSDFYFKANIQTHQGSAIAEMHCQKPKNGLFAYTGWLDAVNLHVGNILGEKFLGEITAHLEVDGKGISLEDIQLDVSGNAQSVFVNGYTYSNIVFPKAHIEDKVFEGELTINDKNVILDFNGKVDMASTIPQFNFNAEVFKAHLYELNLPVTNKTTSFCGVFEVNGFGKNINEFNGFIKAFDIAVYQDGKDYFFNEIKADAQQNPMYHEINVFSDFVDASMQGQFSIDSIGHSFVELASHIFPSLFSERKTVYNTREKFDFNIKIKDLSVITDFFLPQLEVAQGTVLSGSFNSERDDFDLTVHSDWLTYGNIRVDSIDLSTDRMVKLYTINLTAKDFLLNGMQVFNNPSVLFSTYEENIDINVRWNDADSARWGDLKMIGNFPDIARFDFNFKESHFYTVRNHWTIVSGADLHVDSTSIHLQNFTIYAEDQTVLLNGVVSENPEDKLNIEMANFDLRQLNTFLEPFGYSVKGRVEASGYISDAYNQVYFDADAYVSELKINEEYLGDVWSKLSWDRVNKDFKAAGALTMAGVNQLEFDGVYHVMQAENNLDFNLKVKDLNLKPYNVFVPDALSDLKGNISGDIELTGTPHTPDFKGKVTMQNVAANITLLNTSYSVSGDVFIDNDLIYMNYLPIKDAGGRRARINGAFYHEYFKNYNYEFSLNLLEPFLCLNTTYDLNTLYYGTAYATGDIMVSYDKVRELEIIVNAKTAKGTNITLPLYGAKEVVLQDFVVFVDHGASDTLEDKTDLTGISLEFNLDVTKDALFDLVFDELVGDKISGRGDGNILMEIDRYGNFNMYGQYVIDQGEYMFTLQDVINKRFTVEKGSTISWYGDPYNADINVNAIYNTRAALYDVMSEDIRERYRNKTEVDVVMNLSKSLFNPELKFDIRLPRADENARAVVKSLIDTEEEKNKQVFSLLILNRFLPRMDMVDNSSGGLGLGQTITSELLSNQLSSWLSKLSGQTEIGLNYRSGDETSSSEVAVQLSRQFLDNNLTVSGNFGVAQGASGAGTQEKQNQVIGDVLLEYRLTETVRLQAFNQSNQFDITRSDQAPFTQGFGVAYQQSFDRPRELIIKRKDKRAKKRDKAK